MRHSIKSIILGILAGLIVTMISRVIFNGGYEMHDFIFKIWNMFWPEVIGCGVFLVVSFVAWNVRFFRALRKEEEKKFEELLGEWGTQWHQYIETFSAHVDEHLKRADRNLKTYRESYEQRLKKLEEKCFPK